MVGPGRNDPCPCGSGDKYKRCCLRLSSMSNEQIETKIQSLEELIVLTESFATRAPIRPEVQAAIRGIIAERNLNWADPE